MTMAVPKPEMDVNAGIYRFMWNGEMNVTATLERLIPEGKDLWAELKLNHKSLEGNKLIEQTRINLLSDMKRNQLAKSLSERNSEIDWLNVLKYICVLTIEHYRQGEPIQYLGNQPEDMAQEYQLEPILEKGEPTTIFADGGTGKSYLADYIAVLIHYGQGGFDINGKSINPYATNVLYLDWEATFKDHQRRVWAIKQGLGMEKSNDLFFYRRCSQPLADDIPEIQRIIGQNKIGFIIIDSQVAASDGEQDKSDGARRYYNALRSLNVTSLTLDHVTKGNGLTDSHKPYGSTFKWNLSRSQFELKKSQTPGTNKIQLALYHRKHNEGLLLNPIGYEVEFINNGSVLEKVIFRSADVPLELSTGESKGLTGRIEEFLLNLPAHQATATQISQILKVKPDQIRARLNEHKDDRFVKLANDLWAVRSDKNDEDF